MGITNGSPSGGRIKCFLGRCDTNGHKKPQRCMVLWGRGWIVIRNNQNGMTKPEKLKRRKSRDTLWLLYES